MAELAYLVTEMALAEFICRRVGVTEMICGDMNRSVPVVHVCVGRGATPSSRILIKLSECVRFADAINYAKFYRYNLNGLDAERCSIFPVATGKLGRPQHYILCYR